MKQLIFCVETNKRDQSDEIYIKETIAQFFVKIPNTINISYYPVGGKGNIDSAKTRRELDKKIRMFKPNGDTQVFICFDTDRFERNPDNKAEMDRIALFCSTNGYEFVWFCHDIEEVYIGISINNYDKIKTATNFKIKKKIESINADTLKSNKMTKGKSNIVSVLENYLDRKEEPLKEN